MANPVAGFPDATNTGVPSGTTLTNYTGPMTITTPGTVIEGKAINGPLVIEAADVVIKDCSIHFSSNWGIDAENASNVTVQNCTLVGGGTSVDGNSAILGSGHFIGNDISAVENGITLTSGSSTVEGNYIHDLSDGGSDPHYDGISVQGNQDGVLIQDNTISGRDTSDIFIKNDFGAINDVTVNHNLLIGDPGYDVYVDGRGGHGAVTNVSITDNYVQTGFYGDYSVDQSSPKISGNVEFDQGSSPTQTVAPSTSSSSSSSLGSTSTGTTAPTTSSSDSGDTHTSTSSSATSSTSGSGSTHTGTSDPASSTSTSGSGSSGTGSTSTHHQTWNDSFNFADHHWHHGGGGSHASHSSTASMTSDPSSASSETSGSHDTVSTTTALDDTSQHHSTSWTGWHHDGYADHFTM